ncbi:hypothetical protein ACUYGM_08690 [Enterobacter roggenkampii]
MSLINSSGGAILVSLLFRFEGKLRLRPPPEDRTAVPIKTSNSIGGTFRKKVSYFGRVKMKRGGQSGRAKAGEILPPPTHANDIHSHLMAHHLIKILI